MNEFCTNHRYEASGSTQCIRSNPSKQLLSQQLRLPDFILDGMLAPVLQVPSVISGNANGHGKERISASISLP